MLDDEGQPQRCCCSKSSAQSLPPHAAALKPLASIALRLHRWAGAMGHPPDLDGPLPGQVQLAPHHRSDGVALCPRTGRRTPSGQAGQVGEQPTRRRTPGRAQCRAERSWQHTHHHHRSACGVTRVRLPRLDHADRRPPARPDHIVYGFRRADLFWGPNLALIGRVIWGGCSSLCNSGMSAQQGPLACWRLCRSSSRNT